MGAGETRVWMQWERVRLGYRDSGNWRDSDIERVGMGETQVWRWWELERLRYRVGMGETRVWRQWELERLWYGDSGNG